MKRQTSDDIARPKVLAATCLRPVACQDWGRQIRFQARMLYPFQTSCPSGALGESAGHLLTGVRPHLTDVCFVKHSQGSWAPGQLALAQVPVTGSAMEPDWE